MYGFILDSGYLVKFKSEKYNDIFNNEKLEYIDLLEDNEVYSNILVNKKGKFINLKNDKCFVKLNDINNDNLLYQKFRYELGYFFNTHNNKTNILNNLLNYIKGDQTHF
jgi:hypothetical protein